MLLALAFPPGLAQAQELGDFQAGDDEPPLGWRGSADLGFTLTEGNSETTSLSVGAEGIHRMERQRWTLTGSYLRSTTDGERTADRLDLLARYDVFPSERFFLFAEGRGGFNKPAGIETRIAPGLGAGYQFVSTADLTAAGKTGATYIRDEFVDGSVDEALYGALGQSLELAVNDGTTLSQSLTYNPRLEDLGDYLLHGEIALHTEITESLGLRVTFVDDYDSDPFVDPETGEARARNDITFITGVSYSF